MLSHTFMHFVSKERSGLCVSQKDGRPLVIQRGNLCIGHPNDGCPWGNARGKS